MNSPLRKKISESIKDNSNKPALIPFIVSGYPNIETTKNLINLFESQNVAAIELGIPFSDPLADGEVIQNAAQYAIKNGISIDIIFKMLEEIETTTPIIIFTYFNPILNYGIERFVTRLKELNISGIIVPDLPIEESEEFNNLCKEDNIDLIRLIAPTSGKERIKKLACDSSGFIYLVSSTGVTGVRDDFSTMLSEIISDIKKYTNTPISVGFGVSKPEHIKTLKNMNVDGAIIGSAFIKLITENINDSNAILEKVSTYIKNLYGNQEVK